MKQFLFCALCLCLAGTVLLSAPKPDKIRVVFFQDAAGVNHPHWLDKPVSAGDALAVRGALFGLAQREQAKGNDAFLRAVVEGHYVDSGTVIYQRTLAGGVAIGCGTGGTIGCARVKAIQ